MTPFSAFAAQALKKAETMAALEIDSEDRRAYRIGGAIDNLRIALHDQISCALSELEEAEAWRTHPLRDRAKDFRAVVDEAEEAALRVLLAACDLPNGTERYVDLPEQTP